MTAALLLCLIVGISDGDTLTARCPTADAEHPHQQVRVRLAGIDAPERGQPWGNRARRALADLTHRKQAELDCHKADRWGRQVCRVLVQDTVPPTDAGLAMIERGMAWWYRQYAREQAPEHRAQYEAAEFDARRREAGLWSDPAPVPPAMWRRGKRPRATDTTQEHQNEH